MGYVYRRGRRLWIGFVDATGKERQRSTGYSIGSEDKAREVLRQVESAIKARQEYQPEDGKLTLRRFSVRWIEVRTRRGVATVSDDKARLDKHVLPVLGSMEIEEIRPRHIRELLAELARGPLAPRTRSNILATVRALFRDAVADEVLRSSPVALKRHEAPTRKDADPRWRVTALYTVEELQRIVRTDRIPLDRRVLYALMGLAGLRFGEAAALRWGDLAKADPLPRLWVAGGYSTKTKREKETKTEMPRGVPVIPELGALLEEWMTEGWREMLKMLKRRPVDGDLLIPSRRGRNRSVNHMLKRLHEDLERLGLRRRRQHDFRRTFTSLCRAGGAREDLLRFITHGPSASVMDAYTTLPWEALCEQVHGLHLQLTYSRAKVLEMQQEKWRGGRDLNVYSQDEHTVAVAGANGESIEITTISDPAFGGNVARMVSIGPKIRPPVRTVSGDERALCARILELPEVALYVRNGDRYREAALGAIAGALDLVAG